MLSSYDWSRIKPDVRHAGGAQEKTLTIVLGSSELVSLSLDLTQRDSSCVSPHVLACARACIRTHVPAGCKEFSWGFCSLLLSPRGES